MMSEHEFLDERRRASEDDYFRKRDRELIERMRQAAAAERDRSELSAKTGLDDPALLGELQDLGFTPETLPVLPLVPIVQMAWAEGGITPAERTLLIKVARERGIAEGSPADALLAGWMARKPTSDVFEKATRLIRAMLASGAPDTPTMSAEDLIKYCESIASASGGILGIGRISADERATLSEIANALKSRG
jgi:tellurite resistance protein